ncbi:MAG: MlaD family protein [Desulfotignum sp.]|jgi:paraquat-inducible protein B|nr:MlaD family protein [Desulfotignum sp.]
MPVKKKHTLVNCRLFSLMIAALAITLTAGCTPARFSISFDQVDGLKQGDPVIYENTKVGQVKNITYTKDAVFLVAVEIPETLSDCATEHSRFFIGSAPGDTGAKAVFIEQSEPGGKKIANDAIVAGSTKTPIAAAASSLEAIWQAMEKSMADLMKKIETVPETEEYQALKDAMAEMEQKLKTSGQKMGDTLKKEILPLLEEKLNTLSEKLKQQGQEDKARSLEQDFGRLQDI